MSYVRHSFTPVKNKLLNKNSPAEEHFEGLLIKANIYYVREKGNYRKNTRWSYYDFYLPYYNLYVEIDGSSHNSEEQKAIDKVKERIVRNKIKFITRLTNKEVLDMQSVSVEELLELCFIQSARKRRKGGKEHSRNRYNAVMAMKRRDGRRDILKSANFEIDEEQEIWLYDNFSGNYFHFANIFEAKFTVELSVNLIHELCEQKEYAKSTSRRYVFAYTLADCELRVLQTYG